MSTSTPVGLDRITVMAEWPILTSDFLDLGSPIQPFLSWVGQFSDDQQNPRPSQKKARTGHPAAYLTLQIKAASGEAATPAPEPESDDLDGCDVAVEHATSDEDLPPTEGGVA